jgi:hypothetical protein
MEGTAGVFGPMVIGQDDQTELHVQAMIQSGRRQLDIRIWRRGPTGFAPSRNALTLEASDLDALREGIAELLEVSQGGRQVARVVWDKDEGRRLRAEIEPFGTRFVARFGFWQRARDTWRPADDGLVVAAEQLKSLQDVLDTLRPRLQEPTDGAAQETEIALPQDVLRRWPTPGADWITIEADRLAFHPRGVRITATVVETEGEHRLLLTPWRREESLWTPENVELTLSILDVNALLAHMRDVADAGARPPDSEEEVAGSHGSVIRVRTADGASARMLVIEEKAVDEYVFEQRLALPVEYLARFGRMLAQSGALLITCLSEAERRELQSLAGPEIAPVIVEDALFPDPPEPEPSLEEADPPAPGESTEPGRNQPSGEMAHVLTPVEPEPEPTRRLTPVGEVQLGRHFVYLYLQEEREHHLSLQWDGNSLLVPVDHVQDMLTDLRDLYYNALRGRRGHVSTIEGTPSVQMSVHNQGSALHILLEHEIDGKVTRLSFPVGEVPAFLNSGAAASRKIAGLSGASLGKQSEA